MVEFVPVADEVGAAAGDEAELAAVDQLADILQTATQKGIRRTAEQQPLFLCHCDQLLAFSIGHGERLFGIDMLAGFERRKVVFIVRLRRGQVKDQVDFRIDNDFCT